MPANPRIPARFSLTAIACCAMICVTILLAPVVGARQPVGANAAVVAVIDLERVFNSLASFEAANTEVDAFADSLEAQVQTMRDNLSLKQEEIDLVSGAQREAKLAEVEKLADDLRVFIDWSQLRIERRRVEVLRVEYFKVRDAAEQLSVRFGWDMVLVDDTRIALPPVNTRQEMMRQMSARQMIYTDNRIDVTADLIAELNGAAGAGG